MATLLANLNGELEFVCALLEGEPAHRDALIARETVLLHKREAVMAAIRQFDPNIDPEVVGAADGWWIGRRARTQHGQVLQYVKNSIQASR